MQPFLLFILQGHKIAFLRCGLLVLAGLLLRMPVNAQQAVVDSLQGILSATEEDTTRIRLMGEIAMAYRNHDKESALQVIQEGLAMAEEAQYGWGKYFLSVIKGKIFAYYTEADSQMVAIQQAVETARKLEDATTLIQGLIDLGKAQNTINQKQASIATLKEAYTLAVVAELTDLQFDALNQMGNVYSYLTFYDSADQIFNQAFTLQQKLGNKRNQAGILMNAGNNAARSADLEKALAYYDQSRTILHEIDDQQLEATVFRMMAYSADVSGNYPLSLSYYQQALALYRALANKESIAICLESIGEVYLSLKNYPKAISFFEKGYEEWKSLGSGVRQTDLSIKKGSIHLLKEEFETALTYFIPIYAQRKAAGLTFHARNLHWEIGTCYEKLDQLDSAEVYLQNQLTFATQSNNFISKSKALKGLGHVYHKRGDDQKALAYYSQAKEAAVFGGIKDLEMETDDALYQVYKGQKDYENALTYLEAHRQLRDSFLNERIISQFTWLEANQEFDEEKQRLAFEQGQEIERERSVQRIFMIALGVTVVFLLMIGWFYYGKRKDNKEILAQKKVVEAQKIKLEALDREKSRFFTNISHEFRTPLTVISGMADSITGHEKAKKLIQRNTHNLLNLINQILDLRKLESGNLQTELIQDDIVRYLRYILESFHSLAEGKNIELRFSADPESILMDYDVEKMLRIISNLLSNAIKFTPKGGQVKLEVLEVLSSRFYVLGQQLKTQNLKPKTLSLAVSDTGRGIPADQLPQIFDQFYQVDSSSTREGEGTGIGLSLTHELVKLLGGEISVESELGKGSTFTLHLPITQEAPLIAADISLPRPEILLTEEASPVALTELKEGDLPTLLLIEDNADVVEYLVTCLQGSYDLLVARDGQEGIETALEEVPDLIISDVMMPRKDGLEVCDTLKQDQRTSHIPIILLTAKADADSRISGLERGADAYLSKPFNKAELLVRIRKLIELRRMLQSRYAAAGPLPPSEDIAVQQEDAFILKLQEIVAAHLDDETFKVPQLSEAMGLSRSQIHRKVTALTGRSLTRYVRLLRLQKAQEFLKTTDLNMSEVAYSVGFSSLSYFSRSFTEEFGVAPSEARGK